GASANRKELLAWRFHAASRTPATAAWCFTRGVLAAEQTRHRSMPQQRSGHSAESPLAEPRMAVGTGHQEVGLRLGREADDLLAGIAGLLAGGHGGHVDTVPPQKGTRVGQAILAILLDVKEADRRSPFKEGDAVGQRPPGLPGVLPGDDRPGVSE